MSYSTNAPSRSSAHGISPSPTTPIRQPTATLYADILPASRPRATLDSVPRSQLLHATVRLYLLGALAWDYADTVINIAIRLRRPATKKLCRATRTLRADYDRFRALDLDPSYVRDEKAMSELYETICTPHLSRLCHGLRLEISHAFPTLQPEDAMLVEAVHMAMTVLDTMTLLAAEADTFIRRHYPSAPHSIMPDHFLRLRILLPQFAGDCWRPDSPSRHITARILLGEIKNVELTSRQ